jgi:DNA alkylation damage repair protein AlkB
MYLYRNFRKFYFSMKADPSAVLRENEQLLRRCQSLRQAVDLLPSLIVDPSETSEELLSRVGETECGRSIYVLQGVSESCYIIPGYLDQSRIVDLSHEILTHLIDSPPHSNSLNRISSCGSLWSNYSRNPGDLSCSLNRLRWSCVGFHYNWGERSYNKSEWSHFPKSFDNLYCSVLKAINRTRCGNPLKGSPESAIINFYHSHRVSDRLGGHRDDVEETDSTPLISLSLGRTGIFLIDDQAICLRSGDVLVMAQKARQSLHGVPIVLNCSDRKSCKDEASIESTWRDDVVKFLSKTRISISIRQVY